MNFLPIVQRELLVTARRGTTHWARFALTVLLALFTISSLTGSGGSNPGMVAKWLFTWLMSSAFVLACAACALTADTLSGERREGTLGLLFLTDLRSWDVTFGKLASAGLGAFYAALALVPLLMLPVLAGGVSGAEAARTGIALVAIIVFALATGLAASAREYERGRALRRAAVWVVGTNLLPLIAGWFASGLFTSGHLVELLSPITTLRLAQDLEYRAGPRLFWFSLFLQVFHAAALVMKAGYHLRREISDTVLRDAPLRSREPGAGGEQSYSADQNSEASYRAVNPSLMTRPLRPFHGNPPLEWLISRQRGQKALCWLAAILLVFTNAGFLSMRFFSFSAAGTPPLAFYSLYQLSWVSDGLLAWAASRFLFEARRSGELELLLTTPEGAQGLVSSHWRVMKRLLIGPAMLVTAPCLLQGGCFFTLLTSGGASGPASYQLYSLLYPFFHLVDLVFLAITLNWLGMLFGLTMPRLVSAVGLTLLLAVGVPMLLSYVLQFATRPFFSSYNSFGWLITTFGSLFLKWTLLVGLAFWARRCLRVEQPGELFQADWRKAATEPLHQLALAVRKWRSTPEKRI